MEEKLDDISANLEHSPKNPLDVVYRKPGFKVAS